MNYKKTMRTDENINFNFHINRLTQKAGIKGNYKLHPIFEGGNNKAWRLQIKQDNYFLKKYFISNHDKRDRFGTELSFSLFAWENNVRVIPQPLAADRASRLSLFAFIQGRRLQKNEVHRSNVSQALTFLEKLNSGKEGMKSQSLACASESCFSIEEHIKSLKKKIDSLVISEVNDSLDKEAKSFIKNVICTKWEELEADMYKNKVENKKKIDINEMILSPSDFGFHNAIITEPGKIFFIDFEYAGWDDPAKLICDFFCQPELPVPTEYFNWFTQKVSDMVKNKNNLIWRAKFLFPLYRLKWGCILLNDFIPAHRERKDYSSSNMDKRKIQLDKAVNYLKEFDYGIC